MLTHCLENLSIDFVTGVPVFTYWKEETYNKIIVIVDLRTKMVYYESVKVTIDALGLAEVIINVLVRHYDLLNSIVNN